MISITRAPLSKPCRKLREASSGLRLLTVYKVPESASDGIEVGNVFQADRLFTGAEVQTFLSLTGDSNCIHTSAEAAEAAGFAEPVLPGSLGASLFPAMIGSTFKGAVYARQTLNFRQPAFVGRPVQARLTVMSVKSLRGRMRVAFETKLLRESDGAVFIDGEAVAVIPEDSIGGSISSA